MNINHSKLASGKTVFCTNQKGTNKNLCSSLFLFIANLSSEKPAKKQLLQIKKLKKSSAYDCTLSLCALTEAILIIETFK